MRLIRFQNQFTRIKYASCEAEWSWSFRLGAPTMSAGNVCQCCSSVSTLIDCRRSEANNETRRGKNLRPKVDQRLHNALVALRGVGGEKPTSWQWYTLYYYAGCGLLTQSQCKPEQAKRQTTRWRPKVEGAFHAETDRQRDKQQYWLKIRTGQADIDFLLTALTVVVPLPLPIPPLSHSPSNHVCLPATLLLMSFINKPRAIASLVKFALAARTVDRQDIFVNKPLQRAWFVLLLPETVQPIPGSAPATVSLLLACLLHYNWVYDKSIAHKVFTVRVSSVCVNNLRSS